MKYQLLPLFFFILLNMITINCKSIRYNQMLCVIKNKEAEINLKPIKNFQDIKEYYPGYLIHYQYLIDSLKFNFADTIAFFIKPCFVHRGIVFKIHSGLIKVYYFDFSNNSRKILSFKTSDSSCSIVQNYFAFIKQKSMELNNDEVLIIPDCSTDFLIKIGTSFFYDTIPTSESIHYTNSNTSFKKLINQCDSLMHLYSH